MRAVKANRGAKTPLQMVKMVTKGGSRFDKDDFSVREKPGRGLQRENFPAISAT
jgi:hypothetical protein